MWNKKQRERRDIRKRYKMALRNFDAAMESVNNAQGQVEMWREGKDVYTDKPFWTHANNGNVTLDRPGLHHYLPPTFDIPEPPGIFPEVSCRGVN